MLNRGVIIFLFWLLFLPGTYAQGFPELTFSSLNTSNGLPTNLITSVFKDSRGLIWFGTENSGLLRYDGKMIKSYYHSEPGKGIPSSYIGVICQDAMGWLWMQTLDGLYRMNPVTEEIELYENEEGNKSSLNTNTKPIPFVDSKGNLWITGYSGFQQFDMNRKEFINYNIPPIKNPAWQKYAKSTGNILEDSKGRLWVTCPYGIYLVDKMNRTLKPYFTGRYASATSIAEDDNSDLLVGFWGAGIRKLDPETGRYRNFAEANSIVSSIGYWHDLDNKKWLYYILSKNGQQFVLTDPVTLQSKKYFVDAATAGNISAIYNEQGSRLWLLSRYGLSIIDKNQQYFNKHLLYNGIKSREKELYGEPRSLLVTKDRYLLSTWATGQLYEYDLSWKLKSQVNGIPPRPANINPPSIQNIQQYEKGVTWYGTDSGLVKQSHSSYKIFLPADNFRFADSKNSVRDILKRKDGLYWVRFFGRGMYIFNMQKEKFGKSYLTASGNTANCMAYDKKWQLWLGTSDGLFVYKESVDSFVRFRLAGTQKKLSKQYDNILQLYFDENNIGWIGTNYGLIKIEPETMAVTCILDPAKKVNYEVLRILPDSTGNLWMLSNTSLNSYNTRTGLFRYYTSDNGLPENFVGFPGVLNWLNDSIMVVGSTGIVTSFNPYQLAKQDMDGSILFTDAIVDNKRIVFEVNGENNYTLLIPPAVKSINIHFAFLHYTAARQNKLYYRILSDKDSIWIPTDKGDISLYSLPPGKYHVQVKAEYNGNPYKFKTAGLMMIVQPYWYQSDLFKIFLILLLCGLLYTFVRWRFKTVHQAADLKRRVAETEMAALKAQMNPHFMFNCINSIDAFIQSNDKYNATLYLNKFARLIRNVLDSSKENVVLFSKDITTLRLYIELEELRSDNMCTSHLEIDGELLLGDYKVPPLIIQPFIENAIIHGLRNRETGGGLLELFISINEQYIVYRIKDNGIGRAAAELLNKGKEKSYGMQMSADRIRLFNKEEKPSMVINDLYINGVAAGTEVIVKLKII